jgi:hypothetical protein
MTSCRSTPNPDMYDIFRVFAGVQFLLIDLV